jgi:hypothetical protein
MAGRLIKLRYAARCSECERELPPATQAEWESRTKRATCLSCVSAVSVSETSRHSAPRQIDRGQAGASARRTYNARHERREREARQRLGRLAGAYLALSGDPQSTVAWGVGAKGEDELGAFLDALDDDRLVYVLHDRRMPGTRANVDHIVVSGSGVYVVDAKRYAGKVQRLDRGGLLSIDYRLYVGRRDCTKLVAGMSRQVDAVRDALGRAVVEEFAVPIVPVLCFLDAEWSMFARAFQLSGVWVEWPKSLAKRIQQPGALEPEHIRLLARRIADTLPRA